LFRLAFATAPGQKPLTSLQRVTRRSVLQKVRRQAWPVALALRLLVGVRFQVLFHSPPGVLFTFPSRYSFTIGRQEYLALERGRPRFPRDFTCPVVLKVRPGAQHLFRLQGFHLLWLRFPTDSARDPESPCGVQPATDGLTTPALQRLYASTRPVWALPLSLATTQGISFDFSSSGYLDVSVPPVPLAWLWIHHAIPVHYHRWVAPFGDPRIDACLRLPGAFRRLPRPSSAPGA